MCWPCPDCLALEHGDERRDHRPVRCGVQALVAAAAHRRDRVVVVAAHPHRTALGQQGEVDGVVGGEDRHRDEALVAERAAIERLGGEDHVGTERQRGELLAPDLAAAVDDDAALGGVVVPPPQAALRPGHVVEERLERALRAAARRLDDDDVGAEIGEQLAGPGAQRVAQLDHLESVQRPHQMTPSARSESISAGRQAEDLAEHPVVVLAEQRTSSTDLPVRAGQVHRQAVDADRAVLGVLDRRPQAPCGGALVVVDPLRGQQHRGDRDPGERGRRPARG